MLIILVFFLGLVKNALVRVLQFRQQVIELLSTWLTTVLDAFIDHLLITQENRDNYPNK